MARSNGLRGGPVAAAKDAYLAAFRWRRAVEKELAPLGLTLTQWLVLTATEELVRETGDAVNQNAIAARTELDRMTISQVMKTLAARAWVERGPDASGRAYRIGLTRRGEKTARLAATRVAAATRQFHAAERR
jgi:DNA-binding MarR family transcriptional regulator